jgi:tetratricopeptide (TPR) repeat protein
VNGKFFLLPLAAVLVYANSLANPFVFDDYSAILTNESIRQIATDDSIEFGRPTDGRPLVRLSFALNYALAGYDALSFRIVNLLIHMVCGLLLVGVLRRALPDMNGAAWAAALIWLLHPLNSECINYIAQRSELLMALCYLSVLYAAQRSATDSRGRVWCYVAIAACAVGMMCKESMVTAPLVVMFYDRVFLWSSWRAAWTARRFLYGGLASSWLVLAVLVAGRPRGDSAGWGLGLSIYDYMLNQALMICEYLQRIFWPHPLILDYGFPRLLTLSQVWPQGLLLLALLVLSALALWRRPRVGFAGLCFFFLLAPTSSVVPILTEVGAERRMYLPLILVVVLAVVGVRALWLHRGWSAKGLQVLLWGTALSMSLLTYSRNAEYRSAVSIWRVSVAAMPDNARAHNNLGEALVQADRLDAAQMHFRRAAELRPGWFSAHHNLATSYKKDGQLDSAAVHFRIALRTVPPQAATYAGLCATLIQIGRAGEALSACAQAVALAPPRADYRAQWGQALRAVGEIAEAERVLKAALALDPQDRRAHYELAFIYQGQKKMREAEVHYRRALETAPSFFAAHYNLATLLVDMGREAEAARHFEAARKADSELWQRVRAD